LIKNSSLLEEQKKEVLYADRFFYNNTKLEYFDVRDFAFKTPNNIARHLYIKVKDLEELRKTNIIPSYE
jgi:hypothetical protein